MISFKRYLLNAYKQQRPVATKEPSTNEVSRRDMLDFLTKGSAPQPGPEINLPDASASPTSAGQHL